MSQSMKKTVKKQDYPKSEGIVPLARYGLTPQQRFVINTLLPLAVITYLIGIFGPLFSVEKFFVFSNKVSLASGVIDLFKEKEILLFILIFGFCILFPVAKFILLYKIWLGQFEDYRQRERYLHFLSQFGKWSMLDVFVVAVMLVGMKLGPIAKIEIHFGFYLFAFSVILTMLLTMRFSSLLRSFKKKTDKV